MWLVLAYRGGKVVRVFSNDFVDFEKVRLLEEEA